MAKVEPHVDPRAVTLIVQPDARFPLCKALDPGDSGGFAAAKRDIRLAECEAKPLRVESLEGFCEVLADLREWPCRAIARGAIAPDNRGAERMPRNRTTIVDVARHLVPIDIDGLRVPEWLSGTERGIPTWILNVEGTTSYLRFALPRSVRDATFVWSLSGSALASPDHIRVHVWLWSEQPIFSRDLSLVAERWIEEAKRDHGQPILDAGIYKPSTLLFTSRPSIPPERVDPFSRVVDYGICYGSEPTIDLSREIARAQAESAASEPDGTGLDPNNPKQIAAQAWAQGVLRHILDRYQVRESSPGVVDVEVCPIAGRVHRSGPWKTRVWFNPNRIFPGVLCYGCDDGGRWRAIVDANPDEFRAYCATHPPPSAEVLAQPVAEKPPVLAEYVAESGTLIILLGRGQVGHASDVAFASEYGAVGLRPSEGAKRRPNELTGAMRQMLTDLVVKLQPERVLLALPMGQMKSGDAKDDVHRRDAHRTVHEVDRRLRAAAAKAELLDFTVEVLTWDRKGDTLLDLYRYEHRTVDDYVASMRAGGASRPRLRDPEPQGPLPRGVRAVRVSEFLHRELVWSEELAATQIEVPPATFGGTTHGPVESLSGAIEVATRIADEWPIGGRSLAALGWPGTTKTTAIVKRLIRELAAGRIPVAVVEYESLEVANEKAAEARRLVAELGASGQIEIRVPRGRSEDPDSGAHCARITQAQQLAELARPGCFKCGLKEACQNTEGQYLHQHEETVRAAGAAHTGDGPPVLLFASRAWRKAHQGKVVGRMGVIVSDDAPSIRHLLARVYRFRKELLDQYEDNVADHIEASGAGGELAAAASAWGVEGTEAAERRYRVVSSEPMRRARKEAMLDLLSAYRRNPRSPETMAASRAWEVTVDPERSRRQQGWAVRYIITKAETDALTVGELRQELERQARNMTRYPVVLLAPVLQAVAAGVGRLNGPQFGALDRVLRSLPRDFVHAIQHGDVHQAETQRRYVIPWPWESDEDEPAFTEWLLEVVARYLETERVPQAERVIETTKQEGQSDRAFLVYLPDRHLLKQAERGRLAVLMVGHLPDRVVEAIGADAHYIDAKPKGLRVLMPRSVDQCVANDGAVPFVRRVALGSKASSTKKATTGELLTREFAGLAVSYAKGQGWRSSDVGLVLRKGLAESSGMARLQDAGVGVATYGSTAASSNKLKDVRLLVCQRFAEPPEESERDATVLASVLGLDPIERTKGREVFELVDHGGEVIRVRSYADALVRELAHTRRAQSMLNAIGRCRPLSAAENGESRLVVVVDGHPIPTGSMDVEIVDEGEIREALGGLSNLQTKGASGLAQINERKAAGFEVDVERVTARIREAQMAGEAVVRSAVMSRFGWSRAKAERVLDVARSTPDRGPAASNGAEGPVSTADPKEVPQMGSIIDGSAAQKPVDGPQDSESQVDSLSLAHSPLYILGVCARLSESLPGYREQHRFAGERAGDCGEGDPPHRSTYERCLKVFASARGLVAKGVSIDEIGRRLLPKRGDAINSFMRVGRDLLRHAGVAEVDIPTSAAWRHEHS